MACQPAILEYLVEFRIDGWAYAVIAVSLYRYGRLPDRPYRNGELGFLTGMASLLLCPKLALLAPLFVMCEMITSRPPARAALRAIVAYAGGTGLAVGLFIVYLIGQGIELDRTFQILVRYNAVSNANLGIDHGLLRSVVANRLLFGTIVIGTLGWAINQFGRRERERRPDAYGIALIAWLVVQLLLVSYPYKQYYAPWFLFASTFVVDGCQRLSAVSRPAWLILVVAALFVTVLGDFQTARGWWRLGMAERDRAHIRWMNTVTRPEDRVVGSPPLHPIDRYDSFFLSFNTFDPTGFDAERILSRLPIYEREVTVERFRQELDDHPPALVVLAGDWRIVAYPSGQRQALGTFLRERGYQSIHRGEAWFALRPDRFEQARQSGLLHAMPDR